MLLMYIQTITSINCCNMTYKLDTYQTSAIESSLNELETLVYTVTETTPVVSNNPSKLCFNLKGKRSMSTVFVHA